MAKSKMPPDVSTPGDGSSGTPTTPEREILSRLLFDEKGFLEGLAETADRARKFLQIDPHTGHVVLTEEARRLRVSDQVRILLAGRHFALRLNIITDDKMALREIAAELNRPPSGISTELSDLVREGYVVRHEEGVFSMPFHRIDVTLREVEQSKTFAAADTGEPPEPRRTSTRRATRQKADPVVQSMLEKPMDLSAFSWIRDLKTAKDKGLAGLLIAKDAYGVDEMTCGQLETFLTRTFPMQVTRAAINMGFLNIKSTHIAAAIRSGEIAYSLLPLGRQYLLEVASKGGNGASPEPDTSSAAASG